jgi:hypothetical protein
MLGRPVQRRAEAEVGGEDLADELLDAVEAGDVVRARRLLLAGADPSANSWDVQVMAEAIERLDEPMVRLLLEFGVELGGTGRGGTWLHAAAAGADDPKAVDFFLGLGLDPKGVDDAGWTPLHYAAAYGYHRVYATLVAAGADPLARTPHGLEAAVLLQRHETTPVDR